MRWDLHSPTGNCLSVLSLVQSLCLSLCLLVLFLPRYLSFVPFNPFSIFPSVFFVVRSIFIFAVRLNFLFSHTLVPRISECTQSYRSAFHFHIMIITILPPQPPLQLLKMETSLLNSLSHSLHIPTTVIFIKYLMNEFYFPQPAIHFAEVGTQRKVRRVDTQTDRQIGIRST